MSRVLRARAFASTGALLTVLAVACDGPSGPPPVARLLGPAAAVSGEVGTTVTVTVRAVDARGSALSGVTVSFTPEAEAGTTQPTTVETGANGEATTRWTLGTRAGGQTLRAQADGRSLDVTATVTAGPPVEMVGASAPELRGEVGAALGSPLLVEVRDRFANGVPGVAVTFSVTEGGGGVDPTAGITDAGGRAAATWTLGEAAGVHSARATAVGLSVVAFTATAAPGPPARVEKLQGDGQQAVVGEALAEELLLELRDRFGNPVPEVDVAFVVSEGGGSPDPASGATDASGRVATRWTLGTRAGVQDLEARIPGVDPVVFTARARPGSPDALVAVEGDGQSGVVGTAMGRLLVAAVHDRFGNGVPGEEVGFFPAGGIAGPAAALTDSAGVARTSWTLDTLAGPQTLEARSGALPSVTYRATAAAGPPARILLEAGEAQEATVGDTLPVRPAVRIRDRFGNATPGVDVAFVVAAGAGAADPVTTATDPAGRATAIWRLGTRAGVQALEVRAGDAPVLTVTARARPGPPASLEARGGDDQSAFVGTPLSGALRVGVVDGFGNGVPGVTLTLVATAGGGSVDPGAPVTDSAGEAAAAWTLGTVPGANALEVRVAGLDPVSFRATGRAGPPASLTAVSGGGQEGTVGELLPQPVVLEVRDPFGNPVGDVEIGVAVPGGGGSLAPAPARTDTAGQARIAWTLGTVAGTRELEARVQDLPPVIVSATALPGPPAALESASGNGQTGHAGVVLPQAVTVQVADAFGNGVPGTSVEFRVTEGAGSVDPGRAVTDAAGLAGAAWTLGGALGSHALTAGVQGLPPLILTATARSGPPATVTAVSGNAQSGVVGRPLASPVVVEVQDAFGNPVPEEPVAFTTVEPEGAEGPSAGEGPVRASATALTDASGRASLSWVLGTVAGVHRMEVRAGEAPPATFSATAAPGPASALTRVSGDGQEGVVGQALSDPLVVRVSDDFGNGVPGTAITFQVTGGGGSVSPPTATTDDAGEARTAWILGATPGANVAEVRAPGLGPVAFTASAGAGPPAVVQKVSGDGQAGTVGSAVPLPLEVRVVDAFGNPRGGVSVSFVTTGGGGSLTPAAPVTDASGRATASWTLGPAAGAQSAEARVQGATSAVFTATAAAGAPTQWSKVAGDGQSVPAASSVPVSPTVRMLDAFGNPVPVRLVTFQVTGGGGNLSGVASVQVYTDSTGTAAVGGWSLGAGANALTATTQGLSPLVFTATGTVPSGAYDIELRFVGSVPSGMDAAFAQAEARWESVIAADLPDISISVGGGTCGGVPFPGLDETIDDLVIFVQVTPIDGPGGTLGSAGPCYVRSSGRLSLVGGIRIDSDDAVSLQSAGRLYDVVLHEIGHVLGIGTLWSALSLLQGAGTSDPIFLGGQARSRFLAAGGSYPTGVPVENIGGQGTRDGHWRESLLGRELMTGFLNAGGNPLSAITIGSLLDMGYQVNFGAADHYVVGPAGVAPLAPGLDLRQPWEDFGDGPLFEIDEDGTVRRVSPVDGPPASGPGDPPAPGRSGPP